MTHKVTTKIDIPVLAFETMSGFEIDSRIHGLESTPEKFLVLKSVGTDVEWLNIETGQELRTTRLPSRNEMTYHMGERGWIGKFVENNKLSLNYVEGEWHVSGPDGAYPVVPGSNLPRAMATAKLCILYKQHFGIDYATKTQ